MKELFCDIIKFIVEISIVCVIILAPATVVSIITWTLGL